MQNVIVLNVVMLKVIVLKVVMLKVVMLSVVMLNVVAPTNIEHNSRVIKQISTSLCISLNVSVKHKYFCSVQHHKFETLLVQLDIS